MKIYGISGLGADERVFCYLDLGREITPIPWITPTPGEKLDSYALRMSKRINNNEEFVIIGVSFGGLIAVEMNKFLAPKKVILISSIETGNEINIIYRAIGRSRIIQSLPTWLFKPPKKFLYFLFGAINKKLLREILDDTDPKFVKWAVNRFLNWRNEKKSNRIVRINGTHDRLIPVHKKDGTIQINKGGHFMVVDRAKEISKIIIKEINGR